MKLEFRISITEHDWHEIRTQYGFNEENLWTHQAALDDLDSLGFVSELSYDYSMARQEQIIIRTFDIDEKTLTMLLLKYPNLLDPVRNYELISVYDK